MKETKTYCDRCYKSDHRKVEASTVCIKCGQDICHHCTKRLLENISVCEYCYDEDDIREIKKDLEAIFEKIKLIEKTKKATSI